MNRIRIVKDKVDLVKVLIELEGKIGLFKIYVDVIVFVVFLVIKKKKWILVIEIFIRELGLINIEVFWFRGYENIIKLIAIVDIRDIKIFF